MKKLVKNSLSVSVALAVMATASMSYANTQKDDEEDSVFQWGKWRAVQTAAGPTNAAPPLSIGFANSQNTTDSSSFVPGVSSPEGSEFREYMAWYSKESHDDGRKYERAFFESVEEGFDGAEGAPSVGFTVSTEAGEQTYTPDMVLEGSSGLKGAGYSADQSEWGSKYGYKNWYQKKNTESESFEYSSVFNELDEKRRYNEGDIAYVAGQWSDNESEITYRKGRQIWSSKTVNDVGFFVSGNTTTLASINQLISGDVQASYSGQFMTAHNFAGNVNMIVDFGSNSWSGDFVTPSSTGGHNLAFSVDNGVVNGVDLSGAGSGSDRNTKGFFHYDQSVTGQVDASFFGTNGQYINGIAEVEGTVTKVGKYSGHTYGTSADNYAGVFTTNQVPEGPIE